MLLHPNKEWFNACAHIHNFWKRWDDSSVRIYRSISEFNWTSANVSRAKCKWHCLWIVEELCLSRKRFFHLLQFTNGEMKVRKDGKTKKRRQNDACHPMDCSCDLNVRVAILRQTSLHWRQFWLRLSSLVLPSLNAQRTKFFYVWSTKQRKILKWWLHAYSMNDIKMLSFTRISSPTANMSSLSFRLVIHNRCAHMHTKSAKTKEVVYKQKRSVYANVN